LAAILRGICPLIMRHDHLHRAIDAAFWVASGEVDRVNASVALTRTFGAQLYGVAVDKRVNRCVAVAETIGRLILRYTRDRDRRVVLRINHTQDVFQRQPVIRWPEHRICFSGEAIPGGRP
jgi:hypothetical protein